MRVTPFPSILVAEPGEKIIDVRGHTLAHDIVV
jgi:hypothetical protein